MSTATDLAKLPTTLVVKELPDNVSAEDGLTKLCLPLAKAGKKIKVILTCFEIYRNCFKGITDKSRCDYTDLKGMTVWWLGDTIDILPLPDQELASIANLKAFL